MSPEPDKPLKEAAKKKPEILDEQDSDKPWWKMNLFEVLLLILTTLGIGVAGLTCSIYFKQMKQMRTDQRAWIVLDGAGNRQLQVIDNGNGEKTISTQMQFTNTGKTPAKDVVIGTLLVIVPNGRDTPAEYAGPGAGSEASLLYPNVSVPLTVQLLRNDPNSVVGASPLYISNREYQDLMTGITYVAVKAEGTYGDIFGTKHWFHFCQAVSPPGATIGQVTSRNCVAFNTVDDN
jgi:hypothetical protein